MTRQEIYNKIFKLLEKEQNHLRNRYELEEIGCAAYIELSSARTEEYKEYIKDLALCNDDQLEEKMSFIINTNIETF